MNALTTAVPNPGAWLERRGAVRYRCHRVCHARPNGTAFDLSWGVTLLNLSTHGALLELWRPLSAGTLLAVQPTRACLAEPLLTRVVRVAPAGEKRWLCGCELLEPLSDDVLQLWLDG